MTGIITPSTKGSIPYNGINVKYIDKITKQETWKLVFEDEARKVNPLHDINVTRNELVLDSVKDKNWTDYHEFEAKQHPAWYEKENGEWKQNKVYYGNLIEETLDSLEESRIDGNKKAIESFEKELGRLIGEFNQAPGAVPYVVGLNHTTELAQQYGVPQVSEDYYDSEWNSELVNEEGKFKTNMWFENPYLVENQRLKTHIESLVKGIFPTSADTSQLNEVEINPEFQEKDVAPKPVENQVVTNPILEPVGKNVTPTIDREKEAPIENPDLGGQIPVPLYSIAAKASKFLLDEVNKTQEDSNNLQALYLQNLKFDFKPNIKVVQELYR